MLREELERAIIQKFWTKPAPTEKARPSPRGRSGPRNDRHNHQDETTGQPLLVTASNFSKKQEATSPTSGE